MDIDYTNDRYIEVQPEVGGVSAVERDGDLIRSLKVWLLGFEFMDGSAHEIEPIRHEKVSASLEQEVVNGKTEATVTVKIDRDLYTSDVKLVKVMLEIEDKDSAARTRIHVPTSSHSREASFIPWKVREGEEFTLEEYQQEIFHPEFVVENGGSVTISENAKLTIL